MRVLNFSKLRPFIIILLMTLCDFATEYAHATTVIIGTGTITAHQYPINREYKYAACEMTFLSSEIGASGYIDSISFDKAGGDSSVPVSNIKIYMKETTGVVLPGITLTDYTLVYEGAFPNSSTAGWTGVALGTFFSYSGAGNLSVLIVTDEPGIAAYPEYYATTTTSALNAYYESDLSPWAEPTPLTTTTTRPNIQLTITPACTGAPVAGTIAGPGAAVCPGASFVLKTLGCSASPGIKYEWVSRPAGSSESFTAIPDKTDVSFSTAITSPQEYRMYVHCPGGLTDSTSIYTVNVVAKPSITADGLLTFCSNKKLQLSASTPHDYYYQWNNETGAIAGATEPSYFPGATGKYTITAYTAFCSGITSDTIYVTVLPAPAAVISPAGHFTICAENPVNLNASGGGNCQWLDAGGDIAGATGSSYTTNKQGTYKVVMTNLSSGCSDTSDVVTVDTLSKLAVSVLPSGAVSICADKSLIAISSISRTDIGYTWYKDNILIPGANTPTHFINSAGKFRLVVNTLTCADTSEIIDVAVKPLPVSDITNIGATKAICPGADMLFSASTGTGLLYQWQLDGTDISGAVAKTYNISKPGLYTVKITDSNGCTKISKEMAAFNTPVKPVITPADIKICNGVNIMLYSNAGADAVSYEWKKDGTVLPAITPDISVSGAGSYIVTATDIYNCINTSTAAIVIVNPLPVKPIISKSGTTLSVGAYASYQWYINNKKMTGETSRFCNIVFPGKYFVKVTNAEDCMIHSDTVDVNTLSVDDVYSNNAAITIYPNPASRKVFVETSEPVNITVRNIEGRIVSHGEKVKEIDIKDLAEGLYLLSVTDEQGRIIKQEKIFKMLDL